MERIGLESINSESKTAFKLPLFLSIFSTTSGPLSAHGSRLSKEIVSIGLPFELGCRTDLGLFMLVVVVVF